MVGVGIYPRAMIVHELTRAQARRIAVRAQLLDRARPANLLDVVRQLTLVQVSPTDAVAPSADLVAWSRLGSAVYRPGDLEAAVAAGTIVDLLGVLRPADDLVLYRTEMSDWPGRGELRDWQEHQREWVAANDSCRLDILYRLELAGPLTSRQLPDTCAVPWKSSGWTNNRNVITLLHFMARRGEVAVAGTVGRDRLWDLAERIYPDHPAVPAADAERIQNQRRLRSLGIARPAGPDCLVEPQDVGEAGEPAVVDGVKGSWRVDPTYLDRTVPRPRGAAVPAGSAGVRPDADGRAVRVRLPAGDVQAGGGAALGIFRIADPVWRPIGGQARRNIGPPCEHPAGGRNPPGRTVQRLHVEGDAARDH